MTQKLREQISALADHELPDGEHELLLRRFAVERSLRLHWERYHLIGEAMRKALPAVDTRGLADRVMAELDTGTATSEAAPRSHRDLLRGLAGVAVAASVAVVAIIGLRHDPHRLSPSPSEIVPATGLSPGSAPLGGDLLSSGWDGNLQPAPATLRNSLIDQEDVNVSLTLRGHRYVAPPRATTASGAKKADKDAQTPRQP